MSGEGQALGKYTILAEIGRGGFGTVYRAVDTTLDREVAVKVLHPQLLTDPAFVRRFRQEARALANLRHPHIVTIYEVGEAADRLFIAMELALGPSLAQAIVEGGAIPWSEALTLLRPVCEALDHAHRQGVVHRDLKPNNILLDRERGALLSDFGFARLIGESSASLSGGILGTPAYIAPEVWDNLPATPQADLYGLGCILYEMLWGIHLFQGDTTPAVMRAHFQPLQLPARWPPGVPRELEPVLRRALDKDPARRYPSAGQFYTALAAVEERWHKDNWARCLDEAEDLLVQGNLVAARELVERLCGQRPGDPQVTRLQARLHEEVELAAAYAEASRYLRLARQKAQEVLERRAEYPDRERLFAALRGGGRARREPDEDPGEAARTAAWWLLGLGIFPGVVVGGAGVVGAIGMLKRRPWGRKLGLAAALVMEVAGLAGILYVMLWMSVEPQSDADAIHYVFGGACTAMAFSAGAFLAWLLSREHVARAFGETPRVPAGAWPIAVPMLLTGIGAIPAYGLLRNRRWGLSATIVFLGLLLASSALLAAGPGYAAANWSDCDDVVADFRGRLAADCGYHPCDSFKWSGWDDSWQYNDGTGSGNWPTGVIWGECLVIVLWCAIGIAYLATPGVGAWFRRPAGTSARGRP